MRDVVEDVEPRDPLRLQQLRRLRLGLLQHRREQIARLYFAAGALHVQHRGLQGAAEGQRLIRLALFAAREGFNLLVQVAIEQTAQVRQIRAAGGEDAFALGVVREHVEQMLERQVGVPARGGLAIGDTQE